MGKPGRPKGQYKYPYLGPVVMMYVPANVKGEIQQLLAEWDEILHIKKLESEKRNRSK